MTSAKYTNMTCTHANINIKHNGKMAHKISTTGWAKFMLIIYGKKINIISMSTRFSTKWKCPKICLSLEGNFMCDMCIYAGMQKQIK